MFDEWIRRVLGLNVRFFADDGGDGGAGGGAGGEGGGEGGGGEPGGADPEGGTPDGKKDEGKPAAKPDDSKPAGKPDGRTAEPAMPWYKKLETYDERDEGIYARYKSIEEAAASLPHRERLLNDRNIDFPAEDADDETKQKAHQTILRRMGAMKKAEDYREALDAQLEGLSDAAMELIPEGFLDDICAEAAENQLLPSMVNNMMAKSLARFEDLAREKNDARTNSEKVLKKIFGPRLDTILGNVDQACGMYDEDMFRDDNLKLPEQQRRERGGIVRQMWDELRNTPYGPVLARILNYNHDRLFSEGDGSLGGSHREHVDDAYSSWYKRAKAQYPQRGEEYWDKYAREKVRSGQ